MHRIDIIALCTLVAGLGSFASAVVALGVFHNITVMVILLGFSVAGQTASQLARIYGAPSQPLAKESQTS